MDKGGRIARTVFAEADRHFEPYPHDCVNAGAEPEATMPKLRAAAQTKRSATPARGVRTHCIGTKQPRLWLPMLEDDCITIPSGTGRSDAGERGTDIVGIGPSSRSPPRIPGTTM